MTTFRSTKQRGQSGEDVAALTLRALGYDVHTVAAKRLRYFIEYRTGRKILGRSLKDDGDILGLFDVIAWCPTGTIRLQVKDWATITAPSEQWRGDVQSLHPSAGVDDCWWSLDPQEDFWWVWTCVRDPAPHWMQSTMDLYGRQRSQPTLYVPGRRHRRDNTAPS